MLNIEVIRQHVVVEHHDDDDLLAHYWSAAEEYIEGVASNQLFSQIRSKRFNYFTQKMPIGVNVTEIIDVTYVDPDGTPQTLDSSNYRLTHQYLSDYVELTKPASEWPADAYGILVDYVAGLDPAPAALESAVLLMVGHLYANREASTPLTANDVPHGVMALARPYARRFI